MAVKTYRALRPGYVDGRIVAEGEVFTTEFKELVREEKKQITDRDGNKRPDPKHIPAIKRDKDGAAITKPGACPTWAEEIGAKEASAAVAASGDFPDPNFDAMDDAALQAYAAERNVPFTKNTKRDDLITAIKAAVSYQT